MQGRGVLSRPGLIFPPTDGWSKLSFRDILGAFPRVLTVLAGTPSVVSWPRIRNKPSFTVGRSTSRKRQKYILAIILI